MSRPDSHRFPEARTEIEGLLSSHQRRGSNRVTPAAHQEFRESIAPPDHRDFHPVDYEIAGDPAIEHAPEIQGYGKVKRVLEILDSIENERRTH